MQVDFFSYFFDLIMDVLSRLVESKVDQSQIYSGLQIGKELVILYSPKQAPRQWY